MVPIKTFSLLVFCAVGLTRAAFPADEIHWTITGQTSVTFDWRGPESTIAYGLTPSYGQTATAATPAPLPFSSPGPFWEARLAGLQQNTLYHYSIGAGPDHTFHTPPPRGSAGFTIYVEGDVGDGALFSRMPAVQSMIAAGSPRFVLVVGDDTYANDTGQSHVDGHFNDVMVWSQDAAYMPVWGNHEWDKTTDDLRNYKGRFDLPNAQTSPTAPDSADLAGTPLPYGKDWYWFDYGNTRFIAIPDPYTYGASGPWADWNAKVGPIMDQAQSDSAIAFIVTFGHRPTYSSGNYSPGDLTLRAYLDALAATHGKYGLDLSGHSHNYERSYPQSHVTHITAGGGGAPLEGTGVIACLWKGGCPPPSWSAYRAMHHGAIKLRFTPTAIEGQVTCGPPGGVTSNLNDITCAMGSVIDTFTVFNPPVLSVPGPAPRPFGFDRVGPNPATGQVTLSYTLENWAPATLELLDPAGRRIMSLSVGAPGPGPRSTLLRADALRSPGLYFVRLRQSGRVAVAKVAVTATGH